MKHIRMFLLQHRLPTLLGHICKWSAHSLMPKFPSQPIQYRIRIRNRTELKLRGRRKSILCENGCRLCLFLGVFLPFDIAMPAGIFFGERDVGIDVAFVFFLIAVVLDGFEGS